MVCRFQTIFPKTLSLSYTNQSKLQFFGGLKRLEMFIASITTSTKFGNQTQIVEHYSNVKTKFSENIQNTTTKVQMISLLSHCAINNQD